MTQPLFISGYLGYATGSYLCPSGASAALVTVPVWNSYPYAQTVGVNYTVTYPADLGYSVDQIQAAALAALEAYFSLPVYLFVYAQRVLFAILSAPLGRFTAKSWSVQLTDENGNAYPGDVPVAPGTIVILGPVSGTVTFV